MVVVVEEDENQPAPLGHPPFLASGLFPPPSPFATATELLLSPPYVYVSWYVCVVAVVVYCEQEPRFCVLGPFGWAAGVAALSVMWLRRGERVAPVSWLFLVLRCFSLISEWWVGWWRWLLVPAACLLVWTLSVDSDGFEGRRVQSIMVSLRRRKLLGLCAGKSATSVQISASNENATAESLNQSVKSVLVHPLPSNDSNEQKQVDVSDSFPGSSSLKEEPAIQQFPAPGVKRRKRHRRKHVDDQEPCTMRGVYFKNMKWQAAIKVDKKQIHLGTVGSQEEAAHLYDRAAFMCGREPNFELSEEEKQELGQFKWEDFLEMTRNAITSKKHQRRLGSGNRRKAGTQSRGEWEQEQDARATSASEDMDADGSAL
ncbi:hypothetical protein Taro_009846 [Colocasia esculenta]|uniref:AP2/ERF domain-containing protein n=1 Tax=Colocasia esculenta TaxID=4460 RepID=A0A843U1B9_COLES|nr:hypothetical protein [Colocasia esculenta]